MCLNSTQDNLDFIHFNKLQFAFRDLIFFRVDKIDRCDLAQIGIEKKIEIAFTLSIYVEKILTCKNYQPNQKQDSRDVEILEFLP